MPLPFLRRRTFLLPPAYVRTTGGYVFTGVCLFGGGGVPGLSKGKIFWHQIWLDTCSGWGKNFLSRDPPPLPVKGKIFDTRFGLIHVQTGKKNFCRGTPPPPPPVKGKIFWHQIWLDTCSDRKKNFCRGTPPFPPVKGKFFDTRFGLIHVQTGKFFFVKGHPPPRIARNCYGYAAGGMPLAFTQEDFLVLHANADFEMARKICSNVRRQNDYWFHTDAVTPDTMLNLMATLMVHVNGVLDPLVSRQIYTFILKMCKQQNRRTAFTTF